MCLCKLSNCLEQRPLKWDSIFQILHSIEHFFRKVWTSNLLEQISWPSWLYQDTIDSDGGIWTTHKRQRSRFVWYNKEKDGKEGNIFCFLSIGRNIVVLPHLNHPLVKIEAMGRLFPVSTFSSSKHTGGRLFFIALTSVRDKGHTWLVHINTLPVCRAYRNYNQKFTSRVPFYGTPIPFSLFPLLFGGLALALWRTKVSDSNGYSNETKNGYKNLF